MSSRETLELYLEALLKRARTLIWLRAVAIFGCISLGVVLLTVWLLRKEDFAQTIAIAGRNVLIVSN